MPTTHRAIAHFRERILILCEEALRKSGEFRKIELSASKLDELTLRVTDEDTGETLKYRIVVSLSRDS